MRELKKASSTWARQHSGAEQFAWQEGYGAFSVGPNARDEVKRYIANQEKHHQTKSSREEFEELLNRAGIEWDPKWLD